VLQIAENMGISGEKLAPILNDPRRMICSGGMSRDDDQLCLTFAGLLPETTETL